MGEKERKELNDRIRKKILEMGGSDDPNVIREHANLPYSEDFVIDGKEMPIRYRIDERNKCILESPLVGIPESMLTSAINEANYIRISVHIRARDRIVCYVDTKANKTHVDIESYFKPSKLRLMSL